MTTPWITPYSMPIGVAGAGTMGSGIALTALLADLPVILYDVSGAMLEQAQEYLAKHLKRKNKQDNLSLLSVTERLDDLAEAKVIIEAVPEDIEIKQILFRHLDVICPPPAILATNTSTLSVAEIANVCNHPQRVAGMHFFNPAPVMPLVEIVRGGQTTDTTLQVLQTFAEKLGKTSVLAADTPGFIVNRVARPFYGEALRLLGERVATHDQIDLALRLGAGFRLGAFQLMDLIGIDVNLSAMQSMYEQTFGEPRYRPHPIQVRMVQQKLLGRKSGRGFYDYGETKIREPELPQPKRGEGDIYVSSGSWAAELSERIRQAGYTVQEIPQQPMIAFVRAGRHEELRQQLENLDTALAVDIPILCQCADVTLTEISTWMRTPQRLVGFDGLFFSTGRVATLVPSPFLEEKTLQSVENFVASLGMLSLWIQDSPGLILPRIVCMLANEAVFAIQEGVADTDQIDIAMQLGVNYPRGPLAWAKLIGNTQVLQVLEHLQSEFGEERYRPAPLLRRWRRLSQSPV